MFKKFIQGLVFGAGFGISFFAIWLIGVQCLLPQIIESSVTEPEFKDSKRAQIIAPNEQVLLEGTTRSYSFFKSHGSRMKIPAGGGVLSMAKLPTKPGSKRQRTFQLWLTEVELWKIRTNDHSPEIEKIPYPDLDPVQFLDDYMDKQAIVGPGQSTMTVSAQTVQEIREQGYSSRDSSMNGQLKMTTEGVVFLSPDPF